MKTPRQILFQKHEASVPKLDRLRADVLRQHGPGAVEPASSRERNFFAVAAEKLWAELIWPCRRVWAGLAVVWIALLGVQLGTPRSPEAAPRVTSAADLAVALEQRRQLLAELFRPPPPPAEPPKRPPQARTPDHCTRRIV